MTFDVDADGVEVGGSLDKERFGVIAARSTKEFICGGVKVYVRNCGATKAHVLVGVKKGKRGGSI